METDSGLEKGINNSTRSWVMRRINNIFFLFD